MTSKKVFYILLGILILAVIGSISGTIYGTRMLNKTGDVLLERKLEEAVLDKDEQALDQAKQDIERYKELDQVAKTIVPQEKDQARTVRELVIIAEQSGVQIESVNFPESTLGQAPAKSPKNSQSNKSQSAVPPGITQLVPVEGLSGVFAMPISVKLREDAPVTYPQLLSFLQRLEQNRRTSHVTNISIQPDKDDRNLVHFSLQINAYIKP